MVATGAYLAVGVVEVERQLVLLHPTLFSLCHLHTPLLWLLYICNILSMQRLNVNNFAQFLPHAFIFVFFFSSIFLLINFENQFLSLKHHLRIVTQNYISFRLTITKLSYITTCCHIHLGQKYKKKVCFTNFSQKSYVLCFFFFFFRKWAMPKCGKFFVCFFVCFFIVFLAQVFFFFFLLLHGQFFSVFSLATKKKKKMGSAHRAMRRKWVHILMCVSSWDSLFFSWPYEELSGPHFVTTSSSILQVGIF